MDPQADSSSHAQGIGNHQLKMIKKKLHQCQIVDLWRVQHPKVKYYTFHYSEHGTYSRLDYIMVEHRLVWLQELQVDSIVKTDIEIL